MAKVALILRSFISFFRLLNQYWWTKDGSNISLEMTQNNEKNDDNCILGVKIDQPKDTNEGNY